jgi:hypothetical protein
MKAILFVFMACALLTGCGKRYDVPRADQIGSSDLMRRQYIIAHHCWLQSENVVEPSVGLDDNGNLVASPKIHAWFYECPEVPMLVEIQGDVVQPLNPR